MIAEPSIRSNVIVSEWRPHVGPQTEVLTRAEREILYGGARGGGKTDAGMAWLAKPPHFTHPRFRGLVLRRNAKDLDDWLARARYFFGDAIKISGQPPKLHIDTGGEIVTGHLATEDAWDQFLGHEYQKLLFEELTLIPFENLYLRVISSCRSSITELRPQIMATTNPGGPGHGWVKRRFVDVAFKKTYYDSDTGLTRIFIPAKVGDNPSLSEANPEYLRFLDSLEEPLRSAWRDGSWDIVEGQFYTEFGPHLRESPFNIQLSSMEGRLFGSLDSGTTHPTAFGLWFIDANLKIHRLMTYTASGGTIAGHAQEVYNRISTYRYTQGFFPCIIWYDPSMKTKVKLNEYSVRSPIDEYIDLFSKNGRKTVFEPANNDKINGCQICKMMFSARETTNFAYVAAYNKDFEEGIARLMVDRNNMEIYAKTDGDDVGDESRYGMVGCYTEVGRIKQSRAAFNPMPDIHANARGFNRFKPKTSSADWYNS